MFDFFLHVSKGRHPGSIRFDDVSTKNYLKDINYCEELSEGVHFRLSALVHKDASDSYLYIEKGTSLFVLGNVYTTKSYSVSLNSKPHRLDLPEIFKMYCDIGTSFINKIKGIFIIVILDESNFKYHIFSSRNALYDTYFLEGHDFFIASTSLEAMVKFPEIGNEIDPVALIQHSIFDYPLGNKTLFRNIEILPPSNYLTYNLESTRLFKYYDYIPSLNCVDQLTWKETISQTTSQFNEAIDLLIDGKEKLCASLTSGFDSRTNFSRLFHSGKNILYYSWGMPGSIEVQIPKLIADNTGIRYIPLFLDKEFEKSYDYFGKQAVMWSGGKGTIRRANHTYGYSRLFKHSHTIITGLFGSELLRPINAVGHIFNQAFIDVIFSDQQKSKLLELFEREEIKGFLGENMLHENKEVFIEKTLIYFSELNKVGEKYLQLYYFSLTEGFRKYFGHEIHGCRAYVNILSPYIDDDFVAFILQTPIPKLNKFAFKRNPRSLKLGQSFYLPIIENNFSKLMKFPTDRFYSPAQLKSFFYPLSILPGYLKHRKKRKTNDTFNTQRWNNIFIKMNPQITEYFDEYVNSLGNSLSLETNQIDIAKQLSLRFWLIECKKPKKD